MFNMKYVDKPMKVFAVLGSALLGANLGNLLVGIVSMSGFTIMLALVGIGFSAWMILNLRESYVLNKHIEALELEMAAYDTSRLNAF